MDLVLLHGALGTSAQFDALANALAATFRIHRVDFEGHGNVAGDGRPFRVSHFAENVIGTMNRNSMASTAIFGYSMGGYVALHLAATRPELVRAVATLGTKFRWDPATAAREAGRLDPAIIRSRVPKFADTLAERHASAGGWEVVLARTADLLRHLGDEPALTNDTLRSIHQPVMVAVGDRDNTVSVEECEGVIQELPNATLQVLPDTPHPIEQVKVDILADLLRQFFYR
jgi:pimeloyl-ACP methyl ester carboxylesterase